MSSIEEEVFRETTKVVHAFITQLYDQNLITVEEAFELTDIANDALIEETRKRYAKKDSEEEFAAAAPVDINEMPQLLVNILRELPNNLDGLLGQLKRDAEKVDEIRQQQNEEEAKKC